MKIKFQAIFIRKPIATKSDNWQDNSFQWKININDQYFDFYTGKGWIKKNNTPKSPCLDDVLHSLLMDDECCNESFEEWCSNFGYDSDSRKALNIYLLCQENSKKLRKTGIDINAERERLKDY